ncbi:MAG: Flp pilus assembly complex ATPase component TadA [Candidatus Omnitrophica bacterium]|nr:Flp pilus assembly complex ATPase component TadA [Candidatus Omnitrophota bacterium]
MQVKPQVISCFSTKGGVGKTLIVTNLATTLSRHQFRKTALISLAPIEHDVTAMLDSSNVHRVTELLTPASLPGVLATLRQAYSFVVIDAGSVFSELALAAFEHSNLLLLVTTPDVIAIRHAVKSAEALEAMRVPLRMVKAVINRAESRGNFRSAEVRAHLPIEVVAEIPSEGRLVGLSLNQGRPLVLANERGRITDAFLRFGRFLVEHPELFVEHVELDRSKRPSMPIPQPVSLASLAHQAGLPDAHEPEDPVVALKRRVHARLLEKFDLKRLDTQTANNPTVVGQLREQTGKAALELLVEEGGFVPGADAREQLVKEIVDEALGLGPLEDLIADDEVSDILVNGKDQIYIEKRGKLHLTDKRFVSNDQVLTVIERIIAPLGRRIDESTPMVDARLPDGSRVNAIIQPLSLRGPMLSIRKFRTERFSMEDLIRLGTLTPAMAQFLTVCVKARKNIIVSGGTGSGKTTTLNVLSGCIPPGERIVTIEDAAELRLHQEHWVPLEARPPNIEGRGMITIRQLFRNALRMRPDRIIIGECRGDETLDMLQAMNTGHDGSLTTLHANSPQDVISRLDSLILMSNVELPVRAVREQIVSAIHLIVHTARLSDGSRKVTHITEITGMDEHTGVTFGDLFLFHQRGVGAGNEVLGEFKPAGRLPSFLDELRAKGLALDEAMFHP